MPIEPNSLLDANLAVASETDWREAVSKALKGAPLERLRTSTLDGYTIEPLYPRDPAAGIVATPRGAAPWRVHQRIDHPDAAVANDLAMADLVGGAGGLDLVFSMSVRARGYGLAAADRAALDRLTTDVLLDLIALRIDAGPTATAIAHDLLAVAASRQIPAARLTLDLTLDPLGDAAVAGGSVQPLAEAVAAAAREAVGLATTGVAGTLMTADGRSWHEAGASRSQTLAAMLSAAVAYWRALAAAGMDLAAAADRIGFLLPVDHGQFSSIAEIRALRLMWSRATAAAGLGPRATRIHAETAFRMMSRLDANTNLIRTTIAAFAAGVGGADSVTVLPFSAANGLADAFARRLARNSQLVLQEEANLYRVVDPAAGSGRVETETRQLAEAAWAIFREIEAAGGLAANLETGALQSRIAATAADRARDIARRKEPLTGASEFPILGQEAPVVLDLPPQPAQPSAHFAVAFPALASRRLSEPFEALRDRALAERPSVFLANLGRIADFNLRSAWVKNLFEAGGIAGLGNDGFASHDELVTAFAASGTKAVCLASSDAIYAEEAEAVLARLKAAGAAPVFFAGKPADADREAQLRAAGVDVFIHAGQDVLAVLADAQARIAAAR